MNYATALDLHILPHFGDWFVGRITKADVIEWRDRQKGAPASINGRLRVLKTLLADAVDELGLARNPAKRVTALPSEGKKPKTLDVVTLRAVLDAVRRDAPQWYPLTLALAHTGARFGAVSALEWRDIDWSANTIRFERAHYRGTLAKLKIGDPRVVPLTPELRSVLEAHRLSTKGFDLVFPSGVGGYHTPSVLADALKRAGTASGAPLVSPHWFRHTWNNLLRQTASKDVQKALTGHSTDAMAEHYAHVSLPEKWAAVNAILAVIDGGKP